MTLFVLGRHHFSAVPAIALNSLVQFQFFAGGCILALVLRDRAMAWSGPVRFLLFFSGIGLWCIAGGCRWSRGCSDVGAADGRAVIEATMRSFPVVVIDPWL